MAGVAVEAVGVLELEALVPEFAVEETAAEVAVALERLAAAVVTAAVALPDEALLATNESKLAAARVARVGVADFVAVSRVAMLAAVVRRPEVSATGSGEFAT
jgi:hypothetical protein